MTLRSYISTACISLGIASAFAWGQKGHDTVAYIAENHLTPATVAAIDSILEGKSIVYWANWMDNASHTPEYAYTKTWHYKNIDPDFSYDDAPNIDEGNIVGALYEQIGVLNNDNATSQDKELALKMVVHFMGDLHQPMHMGWAKDLGGNKRTVKVFGRTSNLHSAWDSWLPEQAHKWSYTEWQQQIDRALAASDEIMFSSGNPHEWGRETYEICKAVYDTTPEDAELSYDYIAKWTPVIEMQFLKGGLRLADVLNSAFDKDYIPHNNIAKY